MSRIMPFVDGFFGSPASGSYTVFDFLAGCADRRGGVFRDQRARQQSGDGDCRSARPRIKGCERFRAGSFRFKWKDTWRCRPTQRRRWWWKMTLAARDIFAVVNQAPYDRWIRRRSNCSCCKGARSYCTLTIADGATMSNVVDGFGLRAAGGGGAGESEHHCRVPSAAGYAAGARL